MNPQHRKQKSPPDRKPLVQWGLIVGAVVLVGAVLILKTVSSDAGPAPGEDEVGPVVLATHPASMLSPEEQLDRLLAAGEPVFVFFHSNTCVQCVQMTEIVAEVHPSFANRVALVDVNVYDEQNANLLRRAGVQAIPTLIFVDRAGQAQGYVGVMEPDDLRQQLEMLSRE